MKTRENNVRRITRNLKYRFDLIVLKWKFMKFKIFGFFYVRKFVKRIGGATYDEH